MNIENLPKLKGASKVERLTIPVEKEIKNRLYNLKVNHQIDVTEWVRQLIMRELESLEQGA